ncbi:MAG: PilZ domain-containing protein [Desulfuromusa sp.]|nr:PilZ domain-containing protein [Desulfuromusa sp.]
MLKMKCPKCDEMIVSALLLDMDQVPCEHCQELVPVGNVMVFAEGFTFHRNDLLKRLFRYKTLLDEICKERDLLDKNPNASDESKKSLDRLSQALAEVLAGARNNLRIDFTEPISINYRVNSNVQSGSLTNLSMSGACVDVSPKASCPRKKMELSIEFALPSIDYNFILNGTTSWSKKGKSFGMKFSAIDEQTIA